MKDILLSILSLIAFAINGQTINIPDPEFLKDLIKKGIDKNMDGYIQLTEADNVESLSVKFNKIANIEGIEFFKNLKKIHLSSPAIKSFDISKNTKLESLICSSIQINDLDISKNEGLQNLEIHDTPISSLDVSKNINLKSLNCMYNQLTSLIFGQNKSLKKVLCHGNKLID